MTSVGNALFKKSKYREAIAAYNQAATTEGSMEVLANLHSNAAICHLKLGEFRDAAESCRKGLHVDSAHGKLNFRLAEAALMSHDGELIAEAIDAIETNVKKQHPAIKELHTQLARLIVAASLSVEVASGEGSGIEGTRVLLPPRPQRFLPILPEVFSADTAPSSSCINDLAFVPSADGVDENLLVLFHGYGDSASNFLAFGRGLELPQTAVLSLGGPMLVPFIDGEGWFTNIDTTTFNPLPLDKPHKRRSEEVAQLSEQLYSCLAKVAAARRIQLSNVHLLGYGDGGTLALHVALAAREFQQGKGKAGTEPATVVDIDRIKHWAGCFGSVTSIGGPLLPETTSGALASADCPTNVLLMSASVPGSTTAKAAKVCEDTVLALKKMGFKEEDPLKPTQASPTAASTLGGTGSGNGTVRHAVLAPPKLLKGATALPENPSSPPPVARMPRSREQMLPLMMFLASNLKRRMVGMEGQEGFVELGGAAGSK
jgi:predicted esterase